ncbi:MAG: hypothetical protein CR974_02390 [Gammaproteobacteria bacterium]|nr:MAG: hypothetical protein CR974_02390 [Gammaproteobacteria bacterium]
MALLDAIISDIPKDISQSIIKAYPDKQKRNTLADKAILSALSTIIREQKKQEFLELLDNIEPWEAKANQPSTVEMLREIREEH